MAPQRFAYDGSHRLQYYSDPYHNNTNDSDVTYYYDGLDRLSGLVDALSHSTNFDRTIGVKFTVTTLPWITGVRYTISNILIPMARCEAEPMNWGTSPVTFMMITGA